MLVDEAYALASERGADSFAKEVIDTLVAAMTESNNRMCVIFLGYESKMDDVWAMNEGLYSRFPISNITNLEGYNG